MFTFDRLSTQNKILHHEVTFSSCGFLSSTAVLIRINDLQLISRMSKPQNDGQIYSTAEHKDCKAGRQPCFRDTLMCVYL